MSAALAPSFSWKEYKAFGSASQVWQGVNAWSMLKFYQEQLLLQPLKLGFDF